MALTPANNWPLQDAASGVALRWQNPHHGPNQ